MALAQLPNWTCWRYAWDDERGKLGKRIVQARDVRRLASAMAPDDWAPYEVALAAARKHNLGLCFTIAPGSGLVGIDLDHMRDPATGELDPLAQLATILVDSYAEVSPGKDGVHIVAYGALPPAGRKHGQVEIYDQHFLTYTGERLDWMPEQVQHCAAGILGYHADVFGQTQEGQAQPAPITHPRQAAIDDATLLDLARAAANGAKFTALYDKGDWAQFYPSQSEADMGLCLMLEFLDRQGRGAD